MSDRAIKTFEHAGLKVSIYPDDLDQEGPLAWDNLGTMACFHRRYNLGHKDHGIDHKDYESWEEMKEGIVKKHDAVVILPLFLYDHSGLRIKVGSFQGLLSQGHAEFDSGQVGFIFVSREKVLKEYSAKRITKAILAKAEKVLQAEVKTYDQFLSGDVYGYEVEDQEGEHLDSCWGFYGMDDVLDEAKLAAEACVKDKKKGAKAT